MCTPVSPSVPEMEGIIIWLLGSSCSSEPVWPSGVALGWKVEGPRLEPASAHSSLLWTLSCDIVPHN